MGDSHNYMSGAGTVDKLVEAIDGTQYRDRIGLRMEGQMPAPRAQLRSSAMAGVDEAHDLWSAPGSVTPAPGQPPRGAPCPDQHDAPGTEALQTGHRLDVWLLTRNLLRVFHESPPIPRSAVRGGCDPCVRDPLGSDNLDAGRYHPWQAPSIRFSLKLFNRGNRR